MSRPARPFQRQARACAMLAALLAVAAPTAARAAPDCPDQPRVRTLVEGLGTLESVIVDTRGRLYFTDADAGQLLRLDAPGARPVTVAAITEPGGLAFEDAGNVLVGSGNTLTNGAVGDFTGPSMLVSVDPDTGRQEVYATGLSMGNGLVRGPDGSYYASNDGGSGIDRIRDRMTQRRWATVQSGNGLAIDPSGSYLYVAQTFRPAAIQQVEIAHPERVTPYVQPGPSDIAAGLDGMDRDADNRLFVAANGSGEIWRVDGYPPRPCVLLGGLPPFPDGPSAVAVGKPGGPFPPTSVYAVTFGGQVIELLDAAHAAPVPSSVAAPIALRVRVSPTTVTVGRRTTFTFVVERFLAPAWRRVARARVRLAGRTARTDRAGRARMTRRFERAGRHRVTARALGATSAPVTVRVRPRRRRA